jgi:hypothetical protein
VGPESTIVEFRKLSNTSATVRTDGQGPQHPPLAKLNIPAASDLLKILDVLFRSSCEEKQFVEVTLPSQLRFARRQIRVLC